MQKKIFNSFNLTLSFIFLLIANPSNHLFAKKSSINNYEQEILRDLPLDIEDPFVISSDSDTFIPKNIFTTWHTSNLPPNMAQNVEFIRKVNPEFTLYVFDNDNARNFIRKYFIDNVLNAYDCLVPEALKSDVWRYCVLYKYGGVYQDIKYQPINGFKYSLLLDKNYFFRDIKGSGGGIQNGIMISQPNNILFKKCINKIIENVKNKYFGKSCLEPTGPLLMKAFFSQKDLKELKGSLTGAQDYTICFEGKPILRCYKEYKKERAKSGNIHHSILWGKRKTYCKHTLISSS